jgi:hypothetical protein
MAGWHVVLLFGLLVCFKHEELLLHLKGSGIQTHVTVAVSLVMSAPRQWAPQPACSPCRNLCLSVVTDYVLAAGEVAF